MLGGGTVVLAFVLDVVIGEPPQSFHPVAWFGRLVAPLDRQWSRPRLVGVAGALVLPLFAAFVAGMAVAAVASVRPLVAVVVAGITLFTATSFRMLVSTAIDVSVMTERDLGAARERLRALAGRDASTLDAGQVRSAAIESAAENLADGLVAPLLAFAVGSSLSLSVSISLSVAVAAAVWVKAVNTMDSILGYESKPVGWAPARLDDLVMWVPARVSAALLAAAAFKPGSLPSAAGWIEDVPSPNSGWPMGVLAAVLCARLEKPDVYVVNPDAELPSVTAARRGIRTVSVAGLLAYIGTATVSVFGGTVL